MNRILIGMIAFVVTTAAFTLRAAEDIVIADFEGNDYGDWRITGEAFGAGPVPGALPNQMPVEGFLGKSLASSFHQGDATTGTLTSPTFTIERPYLKFLIGGGGFEGKTCINLLVGGKIVRTATGPNTQPGGSERLDWQGWEVKEFAGTQAILQIVDSATGGWGHINVDQILQSDQRVPAFVQDATRVMTFEKHYLNLPVKTGAPTRRMSVTVDGKIQREFDIELADSEPDWWAFTDISAFAGQPATIKVNKIREDSTGLSSIDQSDTIKGSDDLYREALRPQFHFSSRRGWNNDPNGLVFYQGEYHLFYQHNPYGWSWGNMHWGHAISTDLVHWNESSDALYPDEHGTMFSGSAVVDWNNTAGFQSGAEKPLICIFTAAGSPFTQGIAYSNDRGRTWTKYANNPVLPHIAGENRDPKVIWYAPENKWIMALYLQGTNYALFSSSDLKKWDKMSDVAIPSTSECPEFFEIRNEAKAGETRWIFYGGNGHYLIGNFDGRKFNPESGAYPLHQGNSWYASQTYSDIPRQDGRRILIPWGTMATPGMPFNQMMGIPVELRLRPTPEGLRLSAYPVKEIESLRNHAPFTLRAQPLKPGNNPISGVKGELLDIVAELSLGEATELGFNVRGVPLTYDVAKQQLRVKDQQATLEPIDGKIRLRLLVDRTTIEVFGNDGLLYLTVGTLIPKDDLLVQLYAKGGTASINSFELYELKSAWKP